MKKSFIATMMVFVLGGIYMTKLSAISAIAETEKLLSPNLAIQNAPHQPYFENNGNLRYPWEYLTGRYNSYGPTVKDIASLDVAFFPTDEGFDDEKEYATINHKDDGIISHDLIIDQLKSIHAEPNISYSPAFRYVSKVEEYSNSDWYAINDVSYVFDFDYTLNIYGKISVDETGRLVWPWEIFTANPQGAEINHIQVLVFSDDTFEIDDKSSSLATFDIFYEDQFTSRETIEKHLMQAHLKRDEYRFSARLIPTLDSDLLPSHLYPLTGAFPYTPIDLELANVAKNCEVYSGSGNAKAVVDANYETRWIDESNENTIAWLMIDLGVTHYLSKVKIYWEAAYAKEYDVFLENNINVETFNGDTSSFKAVASVKEHDKYIYEDDCMLNEAYGRYLIIKFLSKGTAYNYSIYEIEAYVDLSAY